MPGIYGAIRLGECGEQPDSGEIVASMLAAGKTEYTYAVCRRDFPTGGACFASSGLPNLQQSVNGAFGFLTGLAYGRMGLSALSGSDWLSGVRGSFSFAVCDSRDGTVTVGVDRCASEPIYYTEAVGHLCFAPEPEALLSVSGVSKKADYGALGSLVVSGHLLEDATLFSSIRRLPGGHALRVRRGLVTRLSYWCFAPGSCLPPAEEELLDRLDLALREEVESSLAGEQRENTAIFLSGGYDSRAILGYGQTAGCLRTVSWGTDENSPGTDAEIAGKLASICGARHEFLKREATAFGDLFEEAVAATHYQSDAAAFHPQELQLMRRLCSGGVRRVVRGDETFGWKRRSLSPAGALARVGLRRFGLVEGLSRFFRPYPAALMREASDASAESLLLHASEMTPNQLKDYLYFTQRLQNYLNSCALFKQRVFEHRNPLLSDSVLDLLSFVPDDLREDKKLFRALVARNFPELHAVGYARRDGLENWSVLWKTDSPLRAYLRRQLEDEESGVWDVYDRTYLQEVFDSCSDSARYGLHGLARRGLTRAGRDLLKPLFPRGADHLQAMLNLRSPIGSTKMLLRFLVVKQWIDRSAPVL